MPRRQINNLGDVQIALNDIFNTLDTLTTKPQDFKGRSITNIADAEKSKDAVNLQTMRDFVAEQLFEIKKLIPNKEPQSPPNAQNVVFNKNILPKLDVTYNIGSAALKWLKGWFSTLNIDSLSVSQPIKTNGTRDLVSGKIILTTATDVTGILPVANGGTGGSSVVISFNTRTGAVTLTSADITGASGLLSGAFPGGATVVLAKITSGGTDGSLTVNSDGLVTAYTAPT